MFECSNGASNQITEEAYQQVEAVTIDHGRASKAWEHVSSYEQSASYEGILAIFVAGALLTFAR